MMTLINPGQRKSALRLYAGLTVGSLFIALLAGCASGLLPKPQAEPTLFLLDDAAWAQPTGGAVTPTYGSPRTLVVDPPRAAAGFDGRNIAYVRRAHELEYFAQSQWVDTPSHMLAPLMVRALQRSGAFTAVLQSPSAAVGALRLETELVRLQQDFTQTPSQVRLTLRAVLVETATRRVISWRELETRTVAAKDDAYGGAVAANRAVQTLMVELVDFCRQASNIQ